MGHDDHCYHITTHLKFHFNISVARTAAAQRASHFKYAAATIFQLLVPDTTDKMPRSGRRHPLYTPSQAKCNLGNFNCPQGDNRGCSIPTKWHSSNSSMSWVLQHLRKKFFGGRPNTYFIDDRYIVWNSLGSKPGSDRLTDVQTYSHSLHVPFSQYHSPRWFEPTKRPSQPGDFGSPSTPISLLILTLVMEIVNFLWPSLGTPKRWV